ncbi:alpha/beta-hydrolase [Daedalea quercina L-15889]|uniref:Carboxypeptidase n=1 Tax=Daedalea quercina L-15889 TaxID=1314783 RepID=A0A165KKE7_9APHY|nr:alpha/beta-hydrolase [Daedalea quercina L-15889]
MDTAPLLLWLNGNPRCSSSTGLLFELGPCAVAKKGVNVTYNEHSWNTHTNVIFLDQPVDVSFSYADEGTSVNMSPVTRKDVYTFLELVLTRFSKYVGTPFDIAAESYGGTYAPNIMLVIHTENKVLVAAHALNVAAPGLLHINLTLVLLGNGLTDPYIQHASIPDWVCEGPYPGYDDPDGPKCQVLWTKVPTCQRLVKSCYDFNSCLMCILVILYCNSQIMGPLLGYNPYNIHKRCDWQKDGDLCYKQMLWIETWTNQPSVKRVLGIDPTWDFGSCNMGVNQAFTMQGNGAHNSAVLLPDLIEDGVRLLIYAGNADMMNIDEGYMQGNKWWVEQFDTCFQKEFTVKKAAPWVTTEMGTLVGTVHSAGGGNETASNITFVTVHEAGHMVPYDQPKAGLDLMMRWLFNIPLTLNVSEVAAHMHSGEQV